MPSYKLIYFNARGKAEVARWIFAEAQVKYQDDRIDLNQWATEKKSKKKKFFVLP